jgi:rhodanese-related sulfurtransferase
VRIGYERLQALRCQVSGSRVDSPGVKAQQGSVGSEPAGASSMPSGVDSLVNEARQHLHRLTPEEAHRACQRGSVLIDTRPSDQRERDGTIPGALVIDRNVLEWRLDPTSAHKSSSVADGQRVIVICNEGYSSSLAAATLQRLGRGDATDVIGGFQNWVACGLPVEP